MRCRQSGIDWLQSKVTLGALEIAVNVRKRERRWNNIKPYALAAAKSTKFEMKTLRGTQQYLVTWEANKEQREKARTKEQERATAAPNKALN